MEWTQFMILAITLGGLFLWNRSENNSDRRMFYELLKSIEAEGNSFRQRLAEESKDFHGRLCAIEEKNKK